MAGWTVVRFTWRMLTADPAYVVWATRAALAVADLTCATFADSGGEVVVD
jgi:hypothetical protein